MNLELEDALSFLRLYNICISNVPIGRVRYWLINIWTPDQWWKWNGNLKERIIYWVTHFTVILLHI